MSESNDESRYYSTAEVAERFGLATHTVARAISAGALEAVRVGGSVRITEQALSAWVRPYRGAVGVAE